MRLRLQVAVVAVVLPMLLPTLVVMTTKDTAEIRAGWDDDDDGGGGGGNGIRSRNSFRRIFQPSPVAHVPGQARGESTTWRNHESASTAFAKVFIIV